MLKKLIAIALLTSSLVYASEIKVRDAYVRATPPGLANSAAFMEIKNKTNIDLSIIKASSHVSKVVELHTHEMKNGVMKMYPVPEIRVPANGIVTLRPGGFHIMLIGLNKPLEEGEVVPLTLTLSDGHTVKVMANVKNIMDGMNHQNHDMNHNKTDNHRMNNNKLDNNRMDDKNQKMMNHN